MRHLPALFALTALGAAGPVWADIDPAHHAEAKAAAAQVAVIDIQAVRTPRAPMGQCLIQARVAQVERGDGVRPGDALSLAVWCRNARAEPRDGPIQWQSSERMATVSRARVWLDAQGEILPRRYFEIID